MGDVFKFKQFDLLQTANPHKVGTDSMLLGAWTSGSYQKILDIGTGTGILALMMAQKNSEAFITAIEPHLPSFEEALYNFNQSDFRSRIMCIHTPLQDFSSLEAFDLIICNPPYYDGTYLSSDENRNKARHTADLAIYELYECAAELLKEDGRLNVVVPYTEEREHIERAYDQSLYIQNILHTLREDGLRKRSLISFGFDDVDPIQEEMLVKDTSNRYSKEYITLTKSFYATDLE
ncbi:MAG: methyltransferase [Crocinitomicaceae bacterium]